MDYFLLRDDMQKELRGLRDQLIESQSCFFVFIKRFENVVNSKLNGFPFNRIYISLVWDDLPVFR